MAVCIVDWEGRYVGNEVRMGRRTRNCRAAHRDRGSSFPFQWIGRGRPTIARMEERVDLWDSADGKVCELQSVLESGALGLTLYQEREEWLCCR